MNFSSKLIENAVDQMATLPGIGRKTALRLVLHLLKKDVSDIDRFTNSFQSLCKDIKRCSTCNNLSDYEICEICRNPSRDRSLVCVVEDIRDVMAIESTQQYFGLYHVLGGIISPMDGVGPNDIEVESLLRRLGEGEIKEVLFALSTSMEGETTSYYLFKKITSFDLTVSAIARGVALGDELEYADEMTLGKSILNRQPYEHV